LKPEAITLEITWKHSNERRITHGFIIGMVGPEVLVLLELLGMVITSGTLHEKDYITQPITAYSLLFRCCSICIR
jgi:hypothetical protein